MHPSTLYFRAKKTVHLRVEQVLGWRLSDHIFAIRTASTRLRCNHGCMESPISVYLATSPAILLLSSRSNHLAMPTSAAVTSFTGDRYTLPMHKSITSPAGAETDPKYCGGFGKESQPIEGCIVRSRIRSRTICTTLKGTYL